MKTTLSQWSEYSKTGVDKEPWPDLSQFEVKDVDELPKLYENKHSWHWTEDGFSSELGCHIAVPTGSRFVSSRFELPQRDNFVALLDNPNKFVDVEGIREIRVPTTYSKISKWSPYLSTITQRGSGYGFGLSRHSLRGLFRLTNGKGHIDNSTTVIECQKDRFLAAGPCGCFILKPSTVPKPNLPNQIKEKQYKHLINEEDIPSLNGTLVPEEDEQMQDVLSDFIEVFNTYASAEIIDYQCFTGRHLLETDAGDTVYVTQLKTLKEMETSRSELTGYYQHSFRGESFETTLTEDDIKYEIGEALDTTLGKPQHVLGYDLCWNRKEYIFSGGVAKIELLLSYIYFEETNKYDYHDYNIGRKTVEIASFDV